jgi:hypothetical protein
LATERDKEISEIVVKPPNKKVRSQPSIKPKAVILSKLKLVLRLLPIWVYEWVFKRALYYFKTVNRKAGKTIAMGFLQLETFEHVGSVVKVFKWIILPASIVYVLASFWLLKEITLGSALIGVVFFFYSNFLPDIPAIFRSKYHPGIEALNSRLPWYKNYALLLFAPVFIVLFLCGKKIEWKTIETFHNLKSLAIYIAFLSIIGCLLFARFPIGIGAVAETISLPLYGLAGYLTHLKVDLCI